MTSKEVIKRIVAHDAPPRFGFEFHDRTDIRWVASRRYIDLPDNPYETWGNYPELTALTGFQGETYRDMYGNIHGRFNGKTLGECIRGVIEDWDDYEYFIPKFDPAYRETLLEQELDKRQRTGKVVAVAGIAAALVVTATGCKENIFDTTPEYAGGLVAFSQEQEAPTTKTLSSVTVIE